jgi:hypothetical protein
MYNSCSLGRSKSFLNIRFHPSAIALVAGMLVLCGCGGSGSSSTSGSTPTAGPSAAQDASVSGSYDLVLTSTSGRGTTNIYTNFAQAGKTFTGAASTLVCPSNDLLQCMGSDATAISITPAGTVNGANVAMTITFPTTAGSETVTMTGTAKGTDLAGVYTDSMGDAGTWVASVAIHPFGPPPSVYDYSGTFNSTANPLLIAPTISMELGQDGNSHLLGRATILNSPCISSLVLSGAAIGDAFIVTDSQSKGRIMVLPSEPTLPTGRSFNFSYEFEAAAINCAGDFGHGTMTLLTQPWDY